MTGPTPPTRRWYHFKRRTLFVAVFALCLLTATGGWWMRRARRQSEIVAALEQHHIAVVFNEPPIPDWLTSIIGYGYFQSIDFVMDEGGPPTSTPEVVRLLGELPQLRTIRLSRHDLTDADLQALAKCQELRSLRLFGADQITKAGARHLGAFKHLRELGLQSPGIDEVGIGAISQLPNLVTLELFAAEISAETMAALGSIAGLETLSMQRCSRPITDEDARPLLNLKHLQELLLTPSAISDAMLEQLRSTLPNCRILIIDNTGAKAGVYPPLADPEP